MFEAVLQRVEVLDYEKVNCLTIDPPYKDDFIVTFTKTRLGVDFWGEYDTESGNMVMWTHAKLSTSDSKKIHEISDIDCPRMWNYCKEMCEQF